MQTLSSGFSGILQALTNKEFSIRAFQDYCQDKANNYQKLLNVLSQVVNDIDDEAEFVPITSDDEKITNYIAQCSTVNDQYLCLDGGYILLSDFLTKYYNNTATDVLIEGSDAANTLDIGLIKPSGVLSGIHTTISDAIVNIKSSLHSCTAIVAACSAMKGSSVSEKITLFRDKIGQCFSNAMADISGSSDALLEIVSSSTDTKGFMASLANFIGISSLQDEENDDVPMNTDVYKYTGASPMGPLCFNTVGSAISAVVNIGAKVVGGVFATIGWGLSSLFRSAKTAIHRLACDPYDLGVFNDNAEANTIDGFCWQYQGKLKTIIDWDLDAQVLEQAIPKVLDSMLQIGQNKFYTYKMNHLELLIQFNGYEYVSASPYGYWEVDYLSQVKFLPITKDYFNNVINTCFTVNGYTDDGITFKGITPKPGSTYSDLTNALNSVANDPVSIHNNEDVSERELYASYLRSIALTRILAPVFGFSTPNNIIDKGYFVRQDTTLGNWSVPFFAYTNEDLSNAGLTPDYSDISWFLNVPDTVTNNDFLKIGCGWDGTNFNVLRLWWDPFHRLEQVGSVDHDDANYYVNYDPVWISGLINIVLLHHLDRELFPIDYPFIPYRKAAENFSTSRFYIKSDEQNRAAFNTFGVTVAIVLIVAVAATIIGVGAMKIGRKLAQSRATTVAQMNAALARGEKPTNKQWRKYVRAKRKTEASNKITKGLNGSSSEDSEATTTSNDEVLINILSLMK